MTMSDVNKIGEASGGGLWLCMGEASLSIDRQEQKLP